MLLAIAAWGPLLQVHLQPTGAWSYISLWECADCRLSALLDLRSLPTIAPDLSIRPPSCAPPVMQRAPARKGYHRKRQRRVEMPTLRRPSVLC